MQFPAIPDFAQALISRNYAPVPDDWFVAIGDVVASTPAIAAGRYKDVNLAGAATIAAIKNACPGADLPFAFGGDGGIVLVPQDLERPTRAALQGVQKIGREALSLDLRCALIPVSDIRTAGHDICVAYQPLGAAHSASAQLAMIAGGGIDYADAICKSAEGERYLLHADANTDEADLSGLSCRWQPLLNQRGLILSLIIRARETGTTIAPAYQSLYSEMQNILTRASSPVSAKSLRSTWPPRGAKAERAFGHSWFEIYGQSFLASLSELTGLTIGGFNGRQYKETLPVHSDFRKYADSLRMVIDCSESDAEGIEALLNLAKSKNLIDFGLHRASSALMTCFVSGTDDGDHVHFIDGADGGYALAAQALKSHLSTTA